MAIQHSMFSSLCWDTQKSTKDARQSGWDRMNIRAARVRQFRVLMSALDSLHTCTQR